MSISAPEKITYFRKQKLLSVCWTSEKYDIPAELLRVYSPSADQKKAHSNALIPPSGKSSVDIDKIARVGNYAIKIIFDDGHENGIYSWEHLHDLGKDQKKYWDEYTSSLKKGGASRLARIEVAQWIPPEPRKSD